MQAFLENWLEEVVKRHNRPRTYQKYRGDIEHHIYPHIGRILVTKLTPEQVQKMLNTLRNEGLSARSVSNVRAVLRKSLNHALRWGKITRNVATLVDAPRTTTFTVVPLSGEQALRLLQAVAGHRLEALYRVALSLGLRRGEVCALLWDDIDVATATLRVTGSMQRYDGKLHRTAPKTAGSVRTLALPPMLIQLLQQHRARQQQEREALGEAWQDSGYVFTSMVGTPLEPRNVNRHFKAALLAAGLPQTTRLHDLRHSCATLLIAQGVHPRVVMDILGHTQISTTMNTYAHILPETQREATNKYNGPKNLDSRWV